MIPFTERQIPILCVSNDAMLLETRRMLLVRAGYSVVTQAGSGISASFQLPPCKLVLICQSVHEPECARLLARMQEHGDLPYILMRDRFGEMQVYPHIYQPSTTYRPETLLQCIHNLLQRNHGDELRKRA